MFSPEFSVTARTLEGYTVLSVRGEVDIVTAPQLEEALAARDGLPIIIDLSTITFLASHGIRVLLRERSGARPALVIQPGSHIMRLFDIVDPNHNLPVFPDLKAAMQRVDRAPA